MEHDELWDDTVCTNLKIGTDVCKDFLDNCDDILRHNAQMCEQNPEYSDRYCRSICGVGSKEYIIVMSGDLRALSRMLSNNRTYILISNKAYMYISWLIYTKKRLRS